MSPPLTKLLRIMKLIAILLFVCAMSVSAGGFSQNAKVTLSLKGVKLTRFFKAIEKETNYRFAFSNDIIPSLPGTKTEVEPPARLVDQTPRMAVQPPRVPFQPPRMAVQPPSFGVTGSLQPPQGE